MTAPEVKVEHESEKPPGRLPRLARLAHASLTRAIEQASARIEQA